MKEPQLNKHFFYKNDVGYLDTDYFNRQLEYTDPLHIGVKLEIDFAFALSCIPLFNLNSWIWLSDNSGIDNESNFDVALLSIIGHYFFEIKGHDNKRLYFDIDKDVLDKKIKFAESVGHIPFIAFPDVDCDVKNPENWYIHSLSKKSYLYKLNSKPYLPKLKRLSFKLTELPLMLNEGETLSNRKEKLAYIFTISQLKNSLDGHILENFEKSYLNKEKRGKPKEGVYNQ